ncbi:MAG: BACON domain-containing carbohydrate-binding protein, partial [Acidobacteriota bacterium]
MKPPKAFSRTLRQTVSQKIRWMPRAMMIAILSALTLLANAPGGIHVVNAGAMQKAAQEQRAEAYNTAQCQYIVRPLTQSFAAQGGSGNVTILTSSTCTWTATSNAPWIEVVGITSGGALGQGRLNYSVFPNTEPNQRTGTITVADRTLTVTQAGNSATNCAVTAINTGQTVNGALAAGDCLSSLRIKDGVRPLADRYSFAGTAGQPAIITLTSSGLDTYLYLLNANGSIIAQNDDSAGVSSRIPANKNFFILPASSNFIIEVTSFSGGGQGDYTLSLTMP